MSIIYFRELEKRKKDHAETFAQQKEEAESAVCIDHLGSSRS